MTVVLGFSSDLGAGSCDLADKGATSDNNSTTAALRGPKIELFITLYQ